MTATLERPTAFKRHTHDAAPTSERAARAPRRRRRLGLFLRRVHLYSGLALVPFVALYGVSGWLFNHPSALSRTLDIERVSASQLDELGFAPRITVQALIEELSAAPAFANCVVDQSSAPRLSGRWFAQLSSDGVQHSLTVDAEAEDGRLFTRTRSGAAEPADRSKLVLPGADAAVTSFRSAAGALLESRGLDAQAAELRDAPVFEFGVLRAGESLAATYDLQSKELRFEPRAPATSGDRLRNFALGLHTSHVYPTSTGPRWWWAVVVDALALSMVLWALTGIYMWWQMKSLRRIGAVVLAITAVVSVPLLLSMWSALA